MQWKYVAKLPQNPLNGIECSFLNIGSIFFIKCVILVVLASLFQRNVAPQFHIALEGYHWCFFRPSALSNKH